METFGRQGRIPFLHCFIVTFSPPIHCGKDRDMRHYRIGVSARPDELVFLTNL
jgi:hypothetical protein